mmetsp:Transcript_21230/g.47675  ORF Transcript_21230/g.47675 Transcript_21230/m.47675 type:complete len:89 (+) Transcript_21230:3-269(+)
MDGISRSFDMFEFHIKLERKTGYYVKYVLSPLAVMVFVSWCGFFVQRSAAPARITISIVSFLTINSMITAQLSQLPKLSEQVWILCRI